MRPSPPATLDYPRSDSMADVREGGPPEDYERFLRAVDQVLSRYFSPQVRTPGAIVSSKTPEPIDLTPLRDRVSLAAGRRTA